MNKLQHGRPWPRLLLVFFGILFAACRSTVPTPTPPAPTAAVTPTLSATETPAASPTPLPDAPTTVASYLADWQSGDYAAMYALLAPESQAALGAADFEKQYRSNLTIMSAGTYTPTVTGVAETGDTAQAQVRLTYVTQLVGTVETNVTLPMARVGGRWGIVYSPAIIWPELVNGQQLYMVPFVPDRGVIYDRNGVPMVAQTDAVAIGVIPGEIAEDDDTVAVGLGRLLDIAPVNIAALWEFAVPDQYVPIAEVSAADFARYSYLADLPGTRVTPFTARFYYGNGAAAHVTGYTRFLTPDEVGDFQLRGYSLDQRVGQTGLEEWGERALAGTNGGQLTLLDAAGQPLRAIASGQPTNAQDIYSTVDFGLQEAVQFALGDFTGAAVVLNTYTGEILALASNPTYDPNLFEPSNLNRQFADNGAISAGLLNRATQDAYPAGSVFKIITFSAGLTSGLFTPASLYTCTGTWEEAGPSLILNDWKEGGHGEVTFEEGLSGSCNPYFWHVGKALFDWNQDWLSQTARLFGLGQATGITQIAETSGLIPDPAWKLANKGEAWELVDGLNTAVGQGDVVVTPLQIARMVAAVGNGGTLQQPQLVLRIQPPDGAPTFELQPIAQGQLPLSPEQLAVLQAAMHNVTQEPLGTARNRFRGLRIPVAGKTGTAETAAAEPHAWFAGYTFANRADRPDIAIAVWSANRGQGSDIAAPIFRRIVEAYFKLPYTRYPWEESVGVVKTPEPTPTEPVEGAPAETETPAPP